MPIIKQPDARPYSTWTRDNQISGSNYFISPFQRLMIPDDTELILSRGSQEIYNKNLVPFIRTVPLNRTVTMVRWYELHYLEDILHHSNFTDPEILEMEANRYRKYINGNIGFSVEFDGNLYIINKDVQGNKPINFILVYTMSIDKWRKAPTKGLGPIPKSGFSFYKDRNLVYLTGGVADSEADMESNVVFILDLYSMEWTRYIIPGFIGSSHGCLVIYDEILVHSFGIINNISVNTTQIISTQNLTREFFETPNIPESQNYLEGDTKALVIFLSSIGSVSLILSLAVVLYIRSFSQDKDLKIIQE